jgi:hypothetical protein
VAGPTKRAAAATAAPLVRAGENPNERATSSPKARASRGRTKKGTAAKAAARYMARTAASSHPLPAREPPRKARDGAKRNPAEVRMANTSTAHR